MGLNMAELVAARAAATAAAAAMGTGTGTATAAVPAEPPRGPGSNQETSGLSLTSQQRSLVQHATVIRSGSFVKVGAFAGCGKTTAMISFAEQWLSSNSQGAVLLLMFNKKAVDDVQEKVDSMIERCGSSHNRVCVKTFDGICTSAAMSNYYKLTKKPLQFKNEETLTQEKVVKILAGRLNDKFPKEAKRAAKVLKRFCESDSMIVSKQHIPWRTREKLTGEEEESLAVAAAELWTALSTIDNPGLHCFWTFALRAKLLQTGKLGKLHYSQITSQLADFQCAMVDEAQDMRLSVQFIHRSAAQARECEQCSCCSNR